MSLDETFESPIVMKPNDTVSKAVSLMRRKKAHEVVVMKGNEFLGILIARDLAKRKINEPNQNTIEKFIRKVNPLLPGFGLEDVMNAMMVNDFKSVPIKDENGKIFFITKLGILSEIKSKEFKNKTASDIMTSPYCIGSDDSIATAMSIIRYANISRIPVVDGKNRTLGIVDSTNLLAAEIQKVRSSIGEKSGEKIKTMDVMAQSLMQKNVATAKPETTVSKIIKIMINKKTQTVVIEKNRKLVGIITPKLILKLIGKDVSGIYVRISGLQEEDTFIKSVVDEQIRSEVKKLGKFIPIQFLIMHVDRHHKTGKRVKYSVKSTLATQKGTFYANDFAWDITKAMRGVLQKFEREVMKRKDKSEIYKRG